MKRGRNTWYFLILLLTGMVCTAVGSDAGDAGQTLMHHVMDGHEWQPVPFLGPIIFNDITIGPVTIPVTRHVVMLLINALLLVTVFTAAFRKKRILPSGFASALEPVIFFVRDALVYPTMGEEMGKKWLPFFYTLFFFILTANLLGMIPLFSTSTGNISITGGLAVMVFVTVLSVGMRKHGFFGFFKNMMPSGLPLPIGIVMLFIEIPSLIIRNAVLAVRLFANMLAGHFVIYSLLMLIFLIHPLVSIISVPMALFINLLEVLVAIIQAIVFTMLSSIFISSAVAHH
jgi:F-type H+-transporting ATPase subunit a